MTTSANLAYDPSGSALLTPALHAPLFRADRAYDSVQLGAECARLAYLKAESDPAAHGQLAEALARVGFGAPRLFRDVATGTEGYGALRASDGLALLAFRGTEATTLADLATDIAFVPEPWTEAGGLVHGGFARALRSVLADVRNWRDVDCAQRQRLLLCGHSLGAALATLAASAFQDAASELVTIGSPRVGDEAFAASVRAQRITRLVDCCDLVTHLPLQSPWHVHVGAMHYIDRLGALHAPAPADADVDHDQMRARIEFTLQHALQPGSAGARDLADHAPINYLRALF